MLTVEGGCTSLTINGGVALFTNAATCPTMVINEGASVTWASTAGITTALTVYSNGTIDFSANLSTKTITGCTLHKGSTYLDPAAVTTVEPTMLGIKGSTDVNFVWGQGRQISFI